MKAEDKKTHFDTIRGNVEELARLRCRPPDRPVQPGRMVTTRRDRDMYDRDRVFERATPSLAPLSRVVLATDMIDGTGIFQDLTYTARNGFPGDHHRTYRFIFHRPSGSI